MADGTISKIQLPDNTIYDVVDNTSGYMTGMTILSYGSSTWQNFIDAYSSNKIVYCRASSSSNPASGSQTRLAFMAYVNNATTPTEVEFQYYRSVSTHTASQQGDQVYVYKLNKTNGWSVTVREASVKVVAGTGLGGTYSNGTMTLTGPTKISDLTNDSGFITTETDPTVPSWAKQSSKPTYTASEVGALPSTTSIPTKTSDLTNDSGFITTDTNTWRPIQVNGTQILAGTTGTNALNLKAGTNVSITNSSGTVTIAATDTTYSSKTAASGGTDVSLVTTGEKYTWNNKSSLALGETSSTAYRGDRGKTAYDHSQSTHARTDATAVTSSTTNGKIKINGTETTVYTHPGSGTNPHGTTASDVGLGNVGNFKAVSTVASQGLTTTEQSNARANIGAGTSSFSGSYNDLTNKPTIDTYSAGSGITFSTVGGSITIDHGNSVTAQTTQAVYPIKIDSEGHISAYGSAITPLTASSTLDATKLSGTIPASCYTNTTYATATHLVAGLTRPWYYHSSSATGPAVSSDSTAVSVNSKSSTAGRYYLVEADVNGKSFVNVPWTDNTDTKVTVAENTKTTKYYPILATGTGTATRQIDTNDKLNSETASGLYYQNAILGTPGLNVGDIDYTITTDEYEGLYSTLDALIG